MNTHGGNILEIKRKYEIEGDILDFSANINPLGMNNKVKQGMLEAINSLEHYPDITYFDLKNAIKEYENIGYENILLGNGAAEVIFNISRGLKPKKALLLAPTFSEYEESLKSVDCFIEYYKMDDDFIIKEDFLDRLNESIDITFICNPNNPTGALTEKDFIIRVLDKGRDCNITVVIDESFLDFLNNKEKYSLIKTINEYNNLIIVKSLTKFFAFPGIRLGYGVTGNKEYLEQINKISISWNVNTIASIAGEIALKQEPYMKASIENLREEKDFLLRYLEEFKDIKIFEGHANFIFFKAREDLKEELLKRGILIRNCENYIGLSKGYFRIAVRKREENIEFLKVLNIIYNGES
ncbi:MAG: threonine-phosphate decarboxylase CobD [Clostridium sp.]